MLETKFRIVFTQDKIENEREEWILAETYEGFNILREILFLTLEGKYMKYMYFLK